MSEDPLAIDSLEVGFAVASPRWRVRLTLHVPSGSTVEQVITLARAALTTREDTAARAAVLEAPWQDGACGIYGERVERSQVVTAHDRVELYLPLLADPKLERRRRAEKSQTAKARNPLTVRSRR